jgi:sorbitol-specific phosphotransferase system component IIC
MTGLFEYLGEGFLGFLVVLIIPALIVLLTLEDEKKHHLTTLLENHFWDKIIDRNK